MVLKDKKGFKNLTMTKIEVKEIIPAAFGVIAGLIIYEQLKKTISKK